jgi:hypothetical protein
LRATDFMTREVQCLRNINRVRALGWRSEVSRLPLSTLTYSTHSACSLLLHLHVADRCKMFTTCWLPATTMRSP